MRISFLCDTKFELSLYPRNPCLRATCLAVNAMFEGSTRIWVF